MADSVEERILQDVVATVQTVTIANGYDLDVKLVQRQGQDLEVIRSWPAVVVAHDGTQYSRGGPFTQIGTLNLAIVYALKNEGDDWPTKVAEFRDNIIRALNSDTQRGTYSGNANARRTDITNSFTADADGRGVTLGEVQIAVRFGSDISDPTVAI